ncbi:hypothetical protein M5K25_026545 [Dendrobium thyrsiflorum]|uniref:Uncharacterized protein n=1 Tax=Dendrobium thyrsiflorum TaxID=117978 RepID=A0ABD0TXN3_DENTH
MRGLLIVAKSWMKRAVGSRAEILNTKFKTSLKALYYWSKAKLKDFMILKNSLKREILELQMEESNSGEFFGDKIFLLRSKVNELNSSWLVLTLGGGNEPRLIMECVEEPIFSILVNGIPSSWIKARSGFGQVSWDCEQKKGCSSPWKIILDGAKSLAPIVRWRIARGESIKMFKDVWLLDKRFNEGLLLLPVMKTVRSH